MKRGRLLCGALALGAAFGALAAQAADVDGAGAFKRCSVCHLASGEGVPSAYPPLAGRVAKISRLKGGRAYLVLAPGNGLTGTITVDGVRYQGFMPQQGDLAAGEIAAALNYAAVTLNHGHAPKPFRPFTAGEVEQIRKSHGTLQPSDVAALRASIPGIDQSDR